MAHHRPDLALASFREAVEEIPPACGDELSRALYWLSVALLRLDKKDLALKSLSSAQKLRRRGFARRFYLRTANEYGMPRQPTAELDDFYAFMSVQMAAYLLRRPGRRFSSPAERESVLRILMDAWKALSSGPILKAADCGEKLAIFRRAKPSLPSYGLGQAAPPGTIDGRGAFAGSGIASGIASGARCACGSGLSYGRCCGRVRGLGEL